MMKTLEAIQHDIIQSFNSLNTVDEKYTLLFQLGDDLPPMAPDLKTDENQVSGCQSKLWFHLNRGGGRFHLQADSDSMVIKGIAALLVRLVEGRTADEILTISMDFIDQLKIWKLASERNNGLLAMLDHIHARVRIDQTPHTPGLPDPQNGDKVRPV